MDGKEVDWRDRFPDDVTCVRCLQVKPVEDLDRLLWCEDCIRAARARAARGGWLAGGALAFVLALYIWFVIEPDLSLIPTAWLATLAVAFYLGGRVARELFYGAERLANRRAVEAVPPPPGSSAADGEDRKRGSS
jgi:hypothetical protein